MTIKRYYSDDNILEIFRNEGVKLGHRYVQLTRLTSKNDSAVSCFEARCTECGERALAGVVNNGPEFGETLTGPVMGDVCPRFRAML